MKMTKKRARQYWDILKCVSNLSMLEAQLLQEAIRTLNYRTPHFKEITIKP